MKQRILVLGGSGFIGKRVFGTLAASDWALPIAASRHTVTSSSAAAGHSTSLQLDATDPQKVRRALDGIGGVVNCVAGTADTMVNSARTLFAAAASMQAGPNVVHLSSMAVYGAAIGDVDESVSVGGDLSPYGAAKLRTEQLAGPYPSVVILRPGIVYGPESAQWSTRIAQWLFAHRLGDLGNCGDGYCNLVYIDDVVQAVLRSLREPSAQGRIFNLSLPQPPTWNEYFMLYAKALGAVPVTRITRRRLKIETIVLAPPLKIAEIVIGKVLRRAAQRIPQPIPPSLARLFAQEIRMKVNSAEQVLGLRWTALEEGLARTAAWYRASISKPI